MRKKLTFIMAISLSLSMFLSSCAKPAEPVATTAPESTSAAPTTSEEAKAPEGGLTLHYYSMWNESEAQALVIKDGIAAYEANTGNKVEVTWVGRDLENTIRATLSGGTPVDIWDQDLVKQMQQNIDFMQDLRTQYDKSYPILGDKPLSATMNPALLNLTKDLSKDGNMFGVPYQPYTVLFMYNMEHFEKAGITKNPETWEEFLDVCQKLKDAGYSPTTIDDAYRDLPIGYFLAREKGYEWVSKLMNDKTMWKDPAVLKMATAYEEMAKKGYWDKNVGSAVWPAGQTEVAMGNISMYLTGTWLPNELLPISGPDMKWGAFNFPSVGGEQTNKPAMYASQGFFVPKTSKNADAAFELLATIVSPQFDKEMSEKTVGIPLATDIAWPPILENIKKSFDETNGWIPWGGGLSDNMDVRTIAVSEFAKLIGGEITAQQFVDNMSK